MVSPYRNHTPLEDKISYGCGKRSDKQGVNWAQYRTRYAEYGNSSAWERTTTEANLEAMRAKNCLFFQRLTHSWRALEQYGDAPRMCTYLIWCIEAVCIDTVNRCPIEVGQRLEITTECVCYNWPHGWLPLFFAISLLRGLIILWILSYSQWMHNLVSSFPCVMLRGREGERGWWNSTVKKDMEFKPE